MFRSIRVVAIASVLSTFALAAHAAPGKPLTDADRAEMKSLADDYALPLVNDTNTALKLARDDTPKACEMIHSAEQRAIELDARTKALRDRLAAEGKTTDNIAQILALSADLVTNTHNGATGICRGDLARSGDPKTDAMVDKLSRLINTLTTAMNAYAAADEIHDHAAACSHLRDANVAYHELYAFIIDLRGQIPAGSPGYAQLDAMLDKISPVQNKLALLDTCPAG